MQFLIRVLPSFKASCIVTCITLVCAFRSGHCGELFYNRDIRPILSENCFSCHGQDGNKRQADLRLDHRESAIEKGAIVPGNAGASTLLERIHSSDTEIVMPPPDSIRRLSDRQKKFSHSGFVRGQRMNPIGHFLHLYDRLCRNYSVPIGLEPRLIDSFFPNLNLRALHPLRKPIVQH